MPFVLDASIVLDWALEARRAAAETARLLALARRHGLTVYDAAYLELALREGLDLATLDTELADAARAEGMPLVG
jgi:predicted nucleic acid-binding protein